MARASSGRPDTQNRLGNSFYSDPDNSRLVFDIAVADMGLGILMAGAVPGAVPGGLEAAAPERYRDGECESTAPQRVPPTPGKRQRRS